MTLFYLNLFALISNITAGAYSIVVGTLGPVELVLRLCLLIVNMVLITLALKEKI